MDCAVLFDCDGVIIDTEDQYTNFWVEINKKYVPEDPVFVQKVKGMAVKLCLEQFFADRPDLQEKIADDLNNYETDMKFPYVPGILDFIKEIRSKGIKTALVTSSNELKMSKVYKKLPGFTEMFDVIITARHMTKSKPDPQCYLLAADKLSIPYRDCVVFEDSFAGIRSGMNANMVTIGVSTTNSKEEIEPLCDLVIPDFVNFRYQNLIEALNTYRKL